MKRIFTLIVLLGIVMGAALTGCEQKQTSDTGNMPGTNAPAAPETPSTNQ